MHTPSSDEDLEWLAKCRELAAGSDCVNRRVGAVVVAFSPIGPGLLVGRGWNHNPIHQGPSCSLACPRKGLPAGHPQRTGDYDLCIYVHAEAMAIIEAGNMAAFGTLYCTDLSCPGCWKLIHAAKISRVVSPTQDSRAGVFPTR